VASAVDAASGTKYAQQGLPRDARRALYLIERYMQAKVDPRGGGKPKSVAVVIEYASLVVPAGDLSRLHQDEQATLVTLLRWANDPVLLRSDVTIVLVAENLAEVSPVLVKSPYIGRAEVEHPDEEERREYLQWRFQQVPELSKLADIDVNRFATLTAGLSRVNLNHITSQAVGNQLGEARYDPSRSFNTWIFLKAHQVFVGWCRRRELERRPLPPEVVKGPAADPAPEVERRLDARTLLRALEAELGGEALETFVLRYEGGLSLEQVAEATGCERRTVSRRLEQAHALLERLKAKADR
jgi:RNA polymerase sigma factor (sigma-70 family)